VNRRVAIAGAAYCETGRNLDRTVGDLTLEACRNALADAGMTKDEVDGIAAYQAGGDSVPSFYVVDGMGLGPIRWFEDLGGWMPAAVSGVIAAAEAVANGACDVALAYRTVKRNRERAPGIGIGQARVGGDMQFRAPFGDSMTSQWLAMWARRHMHEFGTTEEHLGHIAVTFREHATKNPNAPLREAITLDDYFASPIVTTPFRILDCDFPVDGGGAVVITTLERARDAAQQPVEVLGTALATGLRPDWDQWPDFTHMASKYAAADLWQRTGRTPADVDLAEVYDGFSWLALCWLEDLGFCAKGEGGPFVKAGNIALGGSIPTNTHGGSLSAGRLHAISHVIECVSQLRGEAGDRQVPGAQTGVVTAGGGTMAGALLFGRPQ
jgi:acetyl-CoA acetyltransferase